jgi:prolyl 4-hydroxylase
MSYQNPKTTKAARMDAEGNHNEAIILLSKAAEAGDMQARTQLGRRMLLGDRAPRMPLDGARLILDAAQKDEPEAVSIMAILQALGVFQEKNWGHALRSLTHAAVLGWVPARVQLLLLATDKLIAEEPTLLDNNAATYWQELGSKVDVNSLLRTPGGRILCDGPMLVSFEEFIPYHWRDYLARSTVPKLMPAFNPNPGMMRNPNAATSTYLIGQYSMLEHDLFHYLLQERMSQACGVPLDQMESLSLLVYREGEEFSEHVDYFHPEQADVQQDIAEYGQRVLTFLIYLNGDYEGGEIEFPELGIKHKPKAGEALYYVNAQQNGKVDPRTRHAGLPPTKGQKWVLSQYFRSRSVNYLMQLPKA